MLRIRPFRALRPVPSQAARVASVPYDVLSTDEARRQNARSRRPFAYRWQRK